MVAGEPNRQGDGYFDPGGVAWRVGREMALLLGGGRALLLQIAHPLVAAGVAEYSGYEHNPWRRLEQTMTTVWTIVYGTRAQADAAATRVRALHGKVRGETAEAMGPFAARTPYSALDPELLLWVHATLVDTALLVYRTWVGPLDELEQRAYYEEMKTLALLMGTSENVIPPTLEDFRAYMRERLASDEICVADAARDIARSVLHPPLPRALRPAMEALALITIDLLPERLRRDYDLGWNRARAVLVAGTRQSLRRVVLPLMPDLLRAVAPARRAEGRSGIDLGRLLPSTQV